MSPPRPKPPWASPLLANLAAAPFVNQRPVQRFKLAAWVVGALLTALNVFLWLQYRHDSTAMRARLAETRSAIETRSRNLVAMNGELDGLGLAAQNAQVAFLNERIAERTFPWSLLFERIADTLPDGVRLLNLNPVFEARDQGKATRAGDRDRNRKPRVEEEELVSLKINGVAKRDEDIYQLVDAFFASPAFDEPRLFQESSSENEVRFTVDVKYRPRFELPLAVTPTGEDEPSHQPAVAKTAEETVGADAETVGADAATAGADAETAGEDTGAGGDGKGDEVEG